VTRPRAADDFPAIRARMKKLRRLRGSLPADDDLRQDSQRPYSGNNRPAATNKAGLSLALRRVLFRVRTR
jgi:hypothetical protein